jgi:hypothetical protein
LIFLKESIKKFVFWFQERVFLTRFIGRKFLIRFSIFFENLIKNKKFVLHFSNPPPAVKSASTEPKIIFSTKLFIGLLFIYFEEF